MRKSLMLFVIVAAAIASPAADDNPAWFGTAGPAPLSDPRKPVMKYDDVFGPLPTAFPHRPGKADELLDARALKADQKRIVGFSLESLTAGDKVWGRRAATPCSPAPNSDGSGRTRTIAILPFRSRPARSASVPCPT